MSTPRSFSRQSSGMFGGNCQWRQVILFIQECGLKLDARELTVATGCMLFQRCKRLMQKSSDTLEDNAKNTGNSSAFGKAMNIFEDDYSLACGCLLLAGKIEENHLNVRKLINVAYNTVFRDRELTNIDDYYALRTSFMTLELWILRLMNFHPDCHHPHKYLVCFLKVLEDWLPRGVLREHPVIGVCWALLRDSYCTSLVMDVLPEHLAVAVIACALQIFHVAVPVSESGQPWTKALCSDLDQTQLDAIVQILISVYSEQNS
ncbi:cyclin-Q-like isoform X2 [Paramacrobiotus metropolitanus]|uniref:cyclin-Q-like isoform X2 n=1 Tax=Paramacrobiotus metropolitanus TaxID=2943436 RepID=UPI00244561C2|nr:cyclin-Q-like isoform X2 [Paramacrobiotus metropolitanus]XP_055356834.1 cyclin-Q-like isoform X2 [Paramacrobiotus metropolitanus]XP_055356835.1 cyclin-Q-like isoform X2 [Paramacrobiotus metropolitanus]